MPRKPYCIGRTLCTLIAGICVVLTVSLQAEESDVAGGEDQVLRTSWYHYDPFIFPEESHGVVLWTGLDVKLTDAVFKEAGLKYTFDIADNWPDLVEDLKEGRKDFALGAFRTPERVKFAYFSTLYRYDHVTLYLPRGEAKYYSFNDADRLFEIMRGRRQKLGAVRGWSYSPLVDSQLADPKNADSLVITEAQGELVELLLNGKIDAYLSTRLTGQTLLWRAGLQDRIEEHPTMLAQVPVYVMFSKKTTTEEEVERFNHAFHTIHESGEYSRIVRSYLFPILLSITLETKWFFMIDIIGTVAFSFSGIFLGRKEKYSVFGTFLLAALPAVGGGMMRDVVVGQHPLRVLSSPVYLGAVIVTVMAAYVVLSLFTWWEKRSTKESRVLRYFDIVTDTQASLVIHVFDAIGLAAFTVIGVVVAVKAQCEPLWLWGPFLAVLTGAGGKILRDVVRSEKEIRSLKGEFYAEVAFLWGMAFSFYLMWETHRPNPNEIVAAVIVVLLGCVGMRLAAIHFKVKGLLF